MAFIQTWTPISNTTDATSRTHSGPTTTAGSTLFLDIMIRSGSVTPEIASVTDNGATGANEWDLVHYEKNSAVNLYMLVCRSVEPITQVTAAWVDSATQEATSLANTIILSEHSEVGDLIPGSVEVHIGDGGMPAAVSLTPGQFLRSIAGVQHTTSAWELQSEGITATERPQFLQTQTTLLRADGYAEASGDARIGWTRTSGSGTLVVASAAFDAPSVLSVDVDGSTSGYVGVPSAVTCAATGGSGTRTYAWTTNASGTFANASAASTTYTPNATGEHILNCAVTDASGTDDDSLAFNASAIPTEDFSAASGWTTVVGTSRLAAISDDDDDTYVQTGDDPVSEALTLTLPAMQRPVGDLIVPLRLSATAGDVAVVPSLVVYDAGPTARTVTAATITVSGGVASYAATFTAAQLADTINWNTGLVLTLTATAV